MIEFRSYYHFGYFAPHGVSPKPDIIAKLLTEFREWNFIPNTIPSFQLGAGQPIQSGSQLQLFTEKKDWVINFEPNRFLIKRQTFGDVPVGTAEQFTVSANEITSILLRLIPISASRLSFSTKALCREMSADELDFINGNIFNLPDIYKRHKPVEWSTRQVARDKKDINGKQETINIITDLNRIHGVLTQKNQNMEFDRIEIGFDINTYHGDQRQRFDSSDTIPFLRHAFAIVTEIESGIEGIFYE